MPRIDPPTPIIEALAEPPGGARRILLATEGPDAPPLSRLLPPGGPPGVMLVVGPEGGWSEADREAALTAGCDAAALGPRVLRSETAGIVAVAVALLLAGDLDGPPPSAPDGGADPAGFDSRRGGP